jgi:hypothetical protein
MNVFHFSGIVSALKFWLGDSDISKKANNTNIVEDGQPSVLWHSMENRVDFIRRLTGIKVLCLAK